MKKLQPKLTKLTVEAQAEALEASFQRLSQPSPAAEKAEKAAAPVVQSTQKTEKAEAQKAAKAAPATKKTAPKTVAKSQKRAAATTSKRRNLEEPPTKREGRTRITVDVPDEIYDLMDANKQENGQSITHLVVSLLRRHFGRK